MKLPALWLGLLAAGAALAANGADPAPPQSPPRPTPAWLKLVDQGTHDPRLKGYLAPEGVKVEIVADYPIVVNPVGMTFADDGTLHVLEWRPDATASFPEHKETIRYKDGSTRTIDTMKKQVRDVVKVLRDTQGKGFYDQAEVILEEELPSSILLHDGWLYLSGRGSVRRYRRSREGGPYDVREVISQGFCGFHHHQVSGLTLGNDGWLYITSGDNDNYAEGSDGSRATVLRTGAVFRCRPDGSRLHVVAIGFRNPYRDVSFDAAGNLFHVDNDNEDGSKFTGCRLVHVAEESDFGWRLRTGARCCEPDTFRGAAVGELPGKMPPLLRTGRGAPAGLLIYGDTRFPLEYRDLLYYPDVFRRLVRAYKVEPQGATFTVAEEFEFLKSEDPLFRPCQMVVGPDGALYVCDWRTDSGGAGRLWGDGKHGRIYRLTWAGTADQPALPPRPLESWARIRKLSDDELLAALAADDASDRQVARRELVRRGPGQRSAVLQLLLDRNQPQPARLAALGVAEALWNEEVRKALLQLLEDGDPDLRRLAADGLALHGTRGDQEVHNALLQVLGDPQPAVRRAVALAMGQVAAPGAADCLGNALRFEEDRDVYLRDGLVRALERVGAAGIEQIVQLAESGVQQDRERAYEAILALRTRPGADAMPRLLTNPHFSTEQRAAVIRSYGNYLLDPPVSLEPLVDYLAAHPTAPTAIQLAGLEVLTLGNAFQGPKAHGLLLTLLDEQEPQLRLAVLQALEMGRVAKAAPRVTQLLADRTRPLPERTAAARALRALGDPAAVAALRDALAEQPVALRLEALRSLALLDPAAGRKEALPLLDADDAALQREAVQTLGRDPAGAKQVGERFLARKLPRELLPGVTEALRRHAGTSPELARLLTEVMRGGLLVSLDPAEVRRVQELVRTRGNAQRGKTLYLTNKTLACFTCHRLEGVGGNAGPDLTRLWETHSLDKVLEALIDPSKEIKEGYQAYVVTTTRGQVYTGLKVAQTADEVVLREATGKEIRLPAKDVEEMVPAKQSLMPDNVVSQLTFEQFLDLVAFLRDRAAQESLRGVTLPSQ